MLISLAKVVQLAAAKCKTINLIRDWASLSFYLSRVLPYYKLAISH